MFVFSISVLPLMDLLAPQGHGQKPNGSVTQMLCDKTRPEEPGRVLLSGEIEK